MHVSVLYDISTVICEVDGRCSRRSREGAVGGAACDVLRLRGTPEVAGLGREGGRTSSRMWRSSVAHVACALVGSAMAAVPADKITHLPGYPGPPKTDQYSGEDATVFSVGGSAAPHTSPPLVTCAMHAGYLEVDDPQGKMYYHYWLATSQSE